DDEEEDDGNEDGDCEMEVYEVEEDDVEEARWQQRRRSTANVMSIENLVGPSE
ncbi:hypothetical protein BGX23_008184, partial [Mortierella sp. AD031]